jgi:hypothetical protein
MMPKISLKNCVWPGAVVHLSNPSYSGDEIRSIEVPSQPRQIVGETLSQKNPSQKRTDGVVQGEALSSSPSTGKKYCVEERIKQERKMLIFAENQ